MKKILTLTLIFLLALQITTFADVNDIEVTLDGKYLSFDQPPVMQNDRVLVPLRAIFEALNATVEWDDATQTVKSTKGDTIVIMQIASPIFTVNSTEKTLDVPPQIIGSRTLVPVRAIAESFDCIVNWDNANQTVIINSKVEITFNTKTITDPMFGIAINASYPELVCDNNIIATEIINKQIKESVESNIKSMSEELNNNIYGKSTFQYDLEFGVPNKSNNLFAVLYTSSITSDNGEQWVSQYSEVYKLDTGERASLTDYFPSKTEEEIIGMIITDFNMIILQEPESFYGEAAEFVEIYIDEAVVYPCGNVIAVTFNPGVIAPYELGFKTLTYPAEF